MINNDCMYCNKNEQLNSVMIPICEIGGFPLYLMRNQTYRGRVVLDYGRHVGKIAEMEEERCMDFFDAVRKTAAALTAVFAPGQINIGMYADKMCHLHCHIVPKYPDGPDWGAVFRMDPQPPVLLQDKEYEEMARRIREAAGAVD